MLSENESDHTTRVLETGSTQLDATHTSSVHSYAVSMLRTAQPAADSREVITRGPAGNVPHFTTLLLTKHLSDTVLTRSSSWRFHCQIVYRVYISDNRVPWGSPVWWLGGRNYVFFSGCESHSLEKKAILGAPILQYCGEVRALCSKNGMSAKHQTGVYIAGHPSGRIHPLDVIMSTFCGSETFKG